MSKSRSVSPGMGYGPATFLQLVCPVEGIQTPHAAGRLLLHTQGAVEIAVTCRHCNASSVYVTRQLPEGYRMYAVRITGEDGPHLPAVCRPVPYLEEEFKVAALSAQDAHERAEFSHSLRLAGHLTRYYIDGVLHLDERF